MTDITHLAGNTSRDDDNLDALEGLVKLVSSITLNLETNMSALAFEKYDWNTNLAGRVDVADVGSDTGSTTNVVEAQGRDEGIALEKERERLSDSSTSTEDGDLGLATRGGGEGTRGLEGTESRATEHRF